jgi:hypothetical protein
VTTFTIAWDKPDVVRAKVREAEAFPVLKVKVGLDTDEEMDRPRAQRHPKSRCAWTANEGWKSKEIASARSNGCSRQVSNSSSNQCPPTC